MSIRSEFEKVMKDECFNHELIWLGDEYDSNSAQHMWEIWQAARQAPASGEVEPVGKAAYSSLNSLSQAFFDINKVPPGTLIYTHPPAKVPEGDRDKVVWDVYEHLCEKFDFNLDPVLDIVGYLVDEGLINTTPTPATTAGAEWVKCSERLPTEADEDPFGKVHFLRALDDSPRLVYTSQIGAEGPLGYRVYEDSCWKPTGLKRPTPPQEQ